MYSFCKDVYYVIGKENACFYDLNRKRLLHCSKDYINTAKKATENNEYVPDSNELNRLSRLLDEQIIEENNNSKHNGSIYSLKETAKFNFAWIEVTTQCNMKCIHCYDESCISNKDELSLKDFKYVIDELDGYGIKNIQLIGGEPLMASNIADMLRYAANKIKSVSLFTNASLITEDIAAILKQHHINVAISVYSYLPEMHDKVTQVKGSHKQTIYGIGLLKKYNIKFRIANVQMNGISIGDKNTELFEIKNSDIVRLSGRANGKLLNDKLIFKKLITLENFKPILEKNYIKNSVNGHNCFLSKLYVASNMNVYPCVMERRLCHGNLKNKHLIDIINSGICSFNKDHVEGCKDCEFRFVCFDCRPNTITGKVNEKPWYCTYQPECGKWESTEESLNRIRVQLTMNQ